jgi:hypothetical protein
MAAQIELGEHLRCLRGQQRIDFNLLSTRRSDLGAVGVPLQRWAVWRWSCAQFRGVILVKPENLLQGDEFTLPVRLEREGGHDAPGVL